MRVISKKKNVISHREVCFDKHIVAVKTNEGRIGVCGRRQNWARRVILFGGNMEHCIAFDAESVEALMRSPLVEEVHAFGTPAEFFAWAAKESR